MSDDLSVFDLPEEGAGDDPLATALAEAAAWQARAERLEGALERLYPNPSDRSEVAGFDLSSPRPEPSRTLAIARSSLTILLALDALESGDLRIEEAREVEGKMKEAEADLYVAVDCLTPEERAAILGGHND